MGLVSVREPGLRVFWGLVVLVLGLCGLDKLEGAGLGVGPARVRPGYLDWITQEGLWRVGRPACGAGVWGRRVWG